jgi:Fur family transcriptional regulator, zinc uptake regulator
MKLALAESVVAVLKGSQRPLGAYAIADKITATSGARCYANSVYRCLATLIDKGRIQPIATVNGYVLIDADHNNADRLIWLICEECQRCDSVPGLSAHTAINEIALARQFQPLRQIIEIVGSCATCRTQRVS